MQTIRIWPVLIASALGLALLLALGVWQMQRLSWKQSLIAEATAALAAEPITLDAALAEVMAGKKRDYVKVKATGQYAPREPLRLLTTANGAAAWQLVQGFDQPNGAPVLVSRGKIAQNQNVPNAPTGQVDVTGLLVWHDQGRGRFDVDNNPERNEWYWWDVVAMSNQFSATHLNPNYAVLNLLPDQPGSEGLVVEQPKANLRNNHLGYAITWFGLAAVLAVMTILFVLQKRRQS
jgi:surfeit locus 1 family protein